MSKPKGDGRHWIEWGVASRMLPGQTVSGDRYFVDLFPTGMLVARFPGSGP